MPMAFKKDFLPPAFNPDGVFSPWGGGPPAPEKKTQAVFFFLIFFILGFFSGYCCGAPPNPIAPKNRPLSNDMPVIPYRKIRKLFL
jgi:hypothetical protein